MAYGFTVGESLGCCGYCGVSFVAELLFGGTHSSINVTGIDGPIAIHNKCLDRLLELPTGEGNFLLLPVSSPLRKAFERRFPETPAIDVAVADERSVRSGSPDKTPKETQNGRGEGAAE